ncbi:MAG: prepilin-type N-terminal cleavage/methylation domain-containing protein [Eubacterium sp.]|jgi:prepilin-type N-terminal cleavage/methylation domain|nr:prepilin-type N-terminal cleavage/methylation domain-containing protein [Eubacterium sp.]
MKRLLKNNNKAYSFVEMLIVIAIIAIAAGMSLISITVINSARAKEASVLFDSEVSNIITKCKNMTPDNDPNKSYALVIYDNGSKDYKVCQAVYDKSTKTYTYDESSLVNLSTRVKVTFEGDVIKGGTADEIVSAYGSESDIKVKGDEAVFIRFDKKGRCVSGNGTFKFYKKNGNQIATVTIRQNGSHESK